MLSSTASHANVAYLCTSILIVADAVTEYYTLLFLLHQLYTLLDRRRNESKNVKIANHELPPIAVGKQSQQPETQTRRSLCLCRKRQSLCGKQVATIQSMQAIGSS
jgi:hypothetical protein